MKEHFSKIISGSGDYVYSLKKFPVQYGDKIYTGPIQLVSAGVIFEKVLPFTSAS